MAPSIMEARTKAPGALERAALEKLEAALERLGWPALARETLSGEGRPAVVLLAPPSIYKLSVAREGGRLSPGAVTLALDASWLSWREGARGGELDLRRAVEVDADGRARLVDYATPRPVGYFANFLTPGANDSDAGLPLERRLAVPMSSSARLERVTNDKLLTRLTLARGGLRVPRTLAFVLPDHPVQASEGPVRVAALRADAAALAAEIEAFALSIGAGELVVKPSGPFFHSGRGVRLLPAAAAAAAARHVLELAGDRRMGRDGAVLIDERVAPPALRFLPAEHDGRGEFGFLGARRVALADSPAAKKDWNLRVIAARTAGGAETTGILARAGSWGLPTTAETTDPADGAVMLSFDSIVGLLRRQHGKLMGAGDVEAFRARLEAAGARAVLALAESEASLPRAVEDPVDDRTDLIGLDVMVDASLDPVVIEVNDHDVGGQAQLDAFHPEQAGAHSRAWLRTALERAEGKK